MEVASTATDVPLPRPFTPIIFAGPGANLYPLCDPYSSSPSESLPKALLPVANRPLISYTLQHLVSAGLKHALLLAPANQHKSIEAALRSIRLHGPPQAPAKGTQASSSSAASSNIAVIDGLAATSSSSSMSSSGSSNVVISVELLPLGPFDGKTTTADDDDESSNGRASEFRKTSRPGTAELLRWIDYIGKLESDPLILPLDFLAPSLPLSTFLLSCYSARDPDQPSVMALLYERGAGESVGREREKEGPSQLFTAYGASTADMCSKATGSLPSHPLLLLSEMPVGHTLDVRLSLLEEHPRTRFTTSLLDSHVYLLRRSHVLPLLNARRDMTSLREHVVPFMAKASWQKGLQEKAGWQIGEPGLAPLQALLGGADEEESINERGQGSALMRLAFDRSSLSTRSVSSNPVRAVACVAKLGSQSTHKEGGSNGKQQQQQQQQRTSSTAAAEDLAESFLARANTLPTYLECNRFLLRSLVTAGQLQRPLAFPLPLLLPQSTQHSNDISTSAQLSPDTLVSEASGVKVGDRSSIKRCAVGPRVAIGRNVRLAGCILMDAAVIGDGAKLENCILGPKAKVADKVTLKDSDVGLGALVKKDGKGERISRGEEPDSEEDSDEGGAEGGD